MMAEARKLLTTKNKGEHEIQTWHVTYFDMDLKRLNEIWEDESEDYEGAYHNGMCGDFDGELFSISVNSFVQFCYNSLNGLDEFEEEYKIQNYNNFIETLGRFKNYTIYPTRVKNNDAPKQKGVQDGK